MPFPAPVAARERRGVILPASDSRKCLRGLEWSSQQGDLPAAPVQHNNVSRLICHQKGVLERSRRKLSIGFRRPKPTSTLRLLPRFPVLQGELLGHLLYYQNPHTFPNLYVDPRQMPPLTMLQ